MAESQSLLIDPLGLGIRGGRTVAWRLVRGDPINACDNLFIFHLLVLAIYKNSMIVYGAASQYITSSFPRITTWAD